jgi:prepilin-type N-terminal cleavage/methylation domain-containing protein/prepilin-type processing-associated H-X9-DG protein
MSGGNTYRGLQLPAGARRRAFTLIELLVVISVVVLLMALLLPALSRARKQARAVVCQNTCRQWGVLSTVYAGENDGRLMDTSDIWHLGGDVDAYSDEFAKPSFLCPEASRNNAGPAPDNRGAWTMGDWTETGIGFGGKFTAWWHYCRHDTSTIGWRLFSGSYGMNGWIGDRAFRPTGLSEAEAEAFRAYTRKRWTRATLRTPSEIPFLFDCAYSGIDPWETDEPPAYEEDFTFFIPDDLWLRIDNTIRRACFDRHAGGTVNVVFLDGSARKVGLKELWTLKWHTQYSTQGPWTKAGGALPEDWPEWMRKLKDY